jgi:NitT/TauT family transport system substrate-binding protein
MEAKAWLGIGLVAVVLVGCAAPGSPARPGEARAGAAESRAAGAQVVEAVGGEPAARPLERIVIAMPSVTGVFAPHHLARDKGFFREEGFEVEFPVMRVNLVVTALSTGEADYDGMIGPSIPPILSGQPHRVLAGVVVKSTRELTVTPEIQTIEQLRGKAIGVASIGGGPYNSGLILFKAFGIDPLHDITWLQIGGTLERLAAMQQNNIQASIFSGSEVTRARAAGFPSLMSLDGVAPLPESGLTASMAKIESDRLQVKRVLRTIVRALQYVKTDREGSLPTFMDYLGLSREEAEQAYDAMVGAYGWDGTVPERTLRFTIDAEKDQVGVTEEVAFSRIVDFGPLYEVLAEMGISPAPGSAQ